MRSSIVKKNNSCREEHQGQRHKQQIQQVKACARMKRQVPYKSSAPAIALSAAPVYQTQCAASQWGNPSGDVTTGQEFDLNSIYRGQSWNV